MSTESVQSIRVLAQDQSGAAKVTLARKAVIDGMSMRGAVT